MTTPPSPTRRARRGPRPYEQLVIEAIEPSIDGGRHPTKAVVGDRCVVQATVYRHGHDRVCAVVRLRPPGGRSAVEVPMRSINPGLDLWQAEFPLERIGRHRFTVAAWTDHYASWVNEFGKRVAAAQPDVASEVAEGLAMVERCAKALRGVNRRRVMALLDRLGEAREEPGRLFDLASATEALELMAYAAPREDEARYAPELAVMADRPLARTGAWYELFIRSQGVEPGRQATFRDAERRLPDIRQMGFDVVYLAPIHPVGHTNRKGPNNRVGAGPDDPGSPWAIGSEHGGHMAVEPALGSLDDFEHFVRAAADHDMEVALDLAIQCSPDHPWVREHPDWFYRRPDGSIRYAENPPKKYEDIYPVNFDTADWRNLWQELLQVVRFWIARGVRIFRVDNPHTKPVGFWSWLIEQVHEDDPDVIFLAEAFTRPPMMQGLGKRGFTQSYTYFTWRNTKAELTGYMGELTTPEAVAAFRPNFFANTPDILPPVLQRGGRPAFKARLTLAATLSPSYGIYSGFELCEHEAIPGREEYLNSEKYEVRVRDWQAPGNIIDYITRVNATRHEQPALQLFDNLRFLDVDDDNLIAYVKTASHASPVIVVVNLDPYRAHASTLHVPADAVGVEPGATYEVFDVLTDRTFVWRDHNYVRLDPIEGEPAHLLIVRP